MMFTIKRIFFIFSIAFLFLSCGLPDASTIALNLNQPFITRAIPGENSVTIEFESQNDEPAFSGYNVYFGDDVNPRLYRIYNEQQQLPTISVNRSANIRKHRFTIEKKLYATKQGEEGVNELDTSDLANGLPMYIWVSSYQIAPTRESSFTDDDFHIAEGITPRYEVIEETVTVNGTMEIQTHDMATLVNTGGTLYLRNASSTMQMRTATSLTDINTAPESGYTTGDLQVSAGRLYLIRKNVSGDILHGKIFVKSVNTTTSTIVVDYCLQTANDILSY